MPKTILKASQVPQALQYVDTFLSRSGALARAERTVERAALVAPYGRAVAGAERREVPRGPRAHQPVEPDHLDPEPCSRVSP